VRDRYEASRRLWEVQDTVQGRLLAAQQELSEETRRLRGWQAWRRPPEFPVAPEGPECRSGARGATRNTAFSPGGSPVAADTETVIRLSV